MTNRRKKIPTPLHALLKTCAPSYGRTDADIFTDDDERMRTLKLVVAEDLTTYERNLLILYAEVQSLAQLAQAFGCSKSSMVAYMKQIKDKVKKQYDRRTNPHTADRCLPD